MPMPHPMPHPAIVCSGPQLESVITELEAGTYPQPDTAIWRGDLPRDQAVRLARATGATQAQIDEMIQQDLENRPRVTYKFDVAAVATVDITTTAGIDAARAAINGMQAIGGADGIDGELPSDASFEVTCVAPRGRGWLVQASVQGDDTDDETDGLMPEPLLDDARDSLKAALEEADEALGGDSNDAEHDALFSVRETIAALLGVTTPAPEPDYDSED